MLSHTPDTPRSRAELAASLKYTDTVTVREPELRGVFDLRAIEALLDEFTFRHASFNEGDKISVGDVRRRGVSQNLDTHGRELVELLRTPEAMQFMEDLLGERRYAEDAQIHRMTVGSALPGHRHGDDDVFAIFHFERSYAGGAYFEERNEVRNYPAIPPYSLFISRGIIFHGVEPVTAGERQVLVTCWTRSSWKS